MWTIILHHRSGINVDGKELWLPLANLVSICALLVWFPDNPDDTITRLLFPGSTPQNKVLRGLEKLKELEFMQKPVCASRSIRQPAPATSQTEKKEAMKASSGLGGHRMTSRSSSGRTAMAASAHSERSERERAEKSDISSKKISSTRSERVNVKRSSRPSASAASAAASVEEKSGPRSPKRKPEDKAQKERRNQAAGNNVFHWLLGWFQMFQSCNDPEVGSWVFS